MTFVLPVHAACEGPDQVGEAAAMHPAEAKHLAGPVRMLARHCAISLRRLRQFTTRVQQLQLQADPAVLGSLQAQAASRASMAQGVLWPLRDDGRWTTKQVVEWVITPETRDAAARYAEVYPGEDGDFGSPMYFISHAWSRPFEETMELLFDYLHCADGEGVLPLLKA